MRPKDRIAFENLAAKIASYYRIPVEELRNPNKVYHVAHARKLFMLMARRMGHRPTDIGAWLGRCSQTVSAMTHRAEQMIATDADAAKELRELAEI